MPDSCLRIIQAKTKAVRRRKSVNNATISYKIFRNLHISLIFFQSLFLQTVEQQWAHNQPPAASVLPAAYQSPYPREPSVGAWQNCSAIRCCGGCRIPDCLKRFARLRPAARDAKIDVAIFNSFGFGGTNGTLVFKRFKDWLKRFETRRKVVWKTWNKGFQTTFLSNAPFKISQTAASALPEDTSI